MESNPTLKIFLVAGEHSGDQLGASLMRGLKTQHPNIEFYGIGGPAMQEQGLSSLFPMDDLAVMGLSEILPRLPLLIKRINQTVSSAEHIKPDCVVTIDAPDFCFRVAKKLKKRASVRSIPIVHYVAPSVWAWRPGRARKVAQFLDHLLALLPFEPPYFEKEGLKCSFIGHPILESNLDQGDAQAFKTRYTISDDKRLLCLLPGSRRSEIERLLPVFCDTFELLKKRIPTLHLIIPTVSTTHATVERMLNSRTISATIIQNKDEKADALKACEVALAASGTVSLELAFAKVPAVIAYRVSGLTALIAKFVLKNKYFSLINLILNRLVTPENIQENCRPEVLARDVEQLFIDSGARQQQLSSYEEALIKLGKGNVNPSKDGARRVLETIHQFAKAKE